MRINSAKRILGKVASLLADAGMAHDEGKNTQRAANLYVAAIDTHPQSPDAYYRLARLLVKDGQQNLAVTFYYRLLKMQLTAGGQWCYTATI